LAAWVEPSFLAVAGWGGAIVALGFATALWLAIVHLLLAGWADVISAVLRSTIIQGVVHEHLRNRVSALQMAVVEGGPRLGDLESGAVATAVSPQFSVVFGGILCYRKHVGPCNTPSRISHISQGNHWVERRSPPDRHMCR
jgi:hypothetical protein